MWTRSRSADEDTHRAVCFICRMINFPPIWCPLPGISHNVVQAITIWRKCCYLPQRKKKWLMLQKSYIIYPITNQWIYWKKNSSVLYCFVIVLFLMMKMIYVAVFSLLGEKNLPLTYFLNSHVLQTDPSPRSLGTLATEEYLVVYLII